MLIALGTMEDEEERKSPLSRILRFTVYALILALYLFFIWRICSRGDTALVGSYAWSDAARAAYTENEDAFVVYTQEVPQSQAEHVTKKGNNFAFALSTVCQTPATNGLQFTLRYNDSMAEALMSEYNLSAPPEEEFFVYLLADQDGNMYTSYTYLSDTRNVNNYRRLVFEDIDFTNTEELFVSIYYIDDVTVSNPLVTFSVWHTERECEPFDFGEPKRSALAAMPTFTVKESN